jgi:MFS family permease
LILWSGQTVSTAGSSISGITLPLLILFLTASPAQAGIAGFLAGLPYVLLSLPAGAYVDRWNRKRVMILCDMGRALALGSIPVMFAFHRLTIEQIYVAVVIEGTLFTFFNIAEVAALPRVVAKTQLPEATSLNQVGQVVSGLVGAPIGGFLFQTAGKTVPYAFERHS